MNDSVLMRPRATSMAVPTMFRIILYNAPFSRTSIRYSPMTFFHKRHLIDSSDCIYTLLFLLLFLFNGTRKGAKVMRSLKLVQCFIQQSYIDISPIDMMTSISFERIHGGRCAYSIRVEFALRIVYNMPRKCRSSSIGSSLNGCQWCLLQVPYNHVLLQHAIHTVLQLLNATSVRKFSLQAIKVKGGTSRMDTCIGSSSTYDSYSTIKSHG